MQNTEKTKINRFTFFNHAFWLLWYILIWVFFIVIISDLWWYYSHGKYWEIVEYVIIILYFSTLAFLIHLIITKLSQLIRLRCQDFGEDGKIETKILYFGTAWFAWNFLIAIFTSNFAKGLEKTLFNLLFSVLSLDWLYFALIGTLSPLSSLNSLRECIRNASQKIKNCFDFFKKYVYSLVLIA